MSSEDAYSLFEAIAQINGLENNLKKWNATKEESEALIKAKEIEKEHASKRSPFSFEELGIKPGTILNFIDDEKITVEVVDDRKVLLNKELTTLTGATKAIRKNNNPINGATCFKYKGKTIAELRDEIGK